MVPWSEAWRDALYGAEGFYRGAAGPAGHFTTSAHGALGAVLAEAIGRLADQEAAAHVVDVGCGRGELLRHLHAARPDLALTGVDVVRRPPGLPDAVTWLDAPGGADLPRGLNDLDGALVVANEWLDVVPCTIAEVAPPGRLAVVLVDPETGEESLGGDLADDEVEWCSAHWPADDLPIGSRVEVGLARDRAWADLVGRVRSGTLLAIDYGHTRPTRPRHGTLAAYRGGHLVDAVPDGSCDLTAHVCVDSLDHDELTTQRDALRALGVSGAPPALSGATADPAAYLTALAMASAATVLTDDLGLGAFRWVLRRVRAW